MPLCECGCSEETKGSTSRFLRGHCRRGSSQSEETKRKISMVLTGVSVPSRGLAGSKNPNAGNTPELFDRDWLLKENKTKTASRIARELNISRATVDSALKRNGLGMSRSDSQKASYFERFPFGRFGESSPNWKGGRFIKKHRKKGKPDVSYWAVRKPDHPNARRGYVLEHRLIMEEKIGRYLTLDEVVHHINGNKLDNRIENLELHSRPSHIIEHHEARKLIGRLESKLATYQKKYGDL